MKKFLSYLAVIVLLNQGLAASDNDSSSLSFSFNADFVSRYIWRGLPMNSTPNIQPYAVLTYKNFAFGAWGSYGISSPYAEVDLYATYNISVFSVTLNDYFNEDETDMSLNNYFLWKKATTPHSLEAVASFNGTDNLPLSFSVGTMFYGNDKDIEGDNLYSTYLELGYTISTNKNEFKLFAGATTGEGYYANKAALVNLGVTFSREIKVSDSFSIPVFSSLILNPNAKDAFLVFGLTF